MLTHFFYVNAKGSALEYDDRFVVRHKHQGAGDRIDVALQSRGRVGGRLSGHVELSKWTDRSASL
jgi:hypothetical protein